MADTPRPEYPRPQWVRPQWQNLNGEWEFAEDPGLSGEERGWASGEAFPQRITVPFAPESVLSGIGKTDFMPCVWYRRTFEVPAAWQGRRLLLHFGAVDYDTTVWVNGQRVGDHRGGYSPFRFDITDALVEGENELVVRAVDDTRDPLQPTGKQSPQLLSNGCVYTRTTGIWQTVWLEPVPEARLERVRMLPDLDNGRMVLEVFLSGVTEACTVQAVAKAEGQVAAQVEGVAQGGFATLVLTLDPLRAWSPEDPFLYDLQLTLRQGDRILDNVGSYFGLRKVHLATPAICLNNRPVFQRLVLDQGFYPDGIYTAPTDEALRRDIELSMALGFNGARLHEKVFEPRFLYWADKLGYLVWGEYPNWGLDDSHPEALERMLPEWLEVLARDFNSPALVGWCPFNETSRVRRHPLLRTVYQVTKAIDPTRPVIDTSGYTHVETDVDDCHDYEGDPAVFAARHQPFAEGEGPWHNREEDAAYQGQPFFVSEYGGIWWNPGQGDENAWGYGGRPKDEAEFLARYLGLTETLLNHPRMCGSCYTQLYDVEQEVNGLLRYDRTPKFPTVQIRAINRQPAAIEL
jgi:beta-galactosidase/beta-glucuronidase